MKRRNWKAIQLLIVAVILALMSGCRQLPAVVSDDDDSVDLTVQPLTDELLDHYTGYVEEAMARWRVPGAAVAIVADGEIVYAEGFGVRELGKDALVTPGTLFGIGSLTKSMNALLVATLVDEGFLTWDTPAVEIWPDFQLADPDATATVTVRDLLSQRTGMGRGDSLWEGKNLSAEDLMVALAQVPMAAQPHTQHSYENMGVATGGYLGAMAAGAEFGDLFGAYADLMQEQVFGPIGMNDSTIHLESMFGHPEQARGHQWNEAGQLVPQAEFFDGIMPSVGIIAAGGVASSANDMARYLITHLNRGLSADGTRVVSAQNLTETWTPQIHIGPDAFTDRIYIPTSLINAADAQIGYGMGWFGGTYNSVPILTNPGDQQGWTAQMALMPGADTGIVILTNTEHLPCGAFITMALQYRFIELRYGLENQIDGYIDHFVDTVRDEFGLECNPSTAASAPAQSSLESALQGLLDAQVAEQGILGMAMAVRAPDGTVIGAGSGYADPAGENAWDVDTQSAIGSVTKSFTAVLIMQLVEEGKLSLDDTIDKWFPKQPNGDKITVRMLLSHTSGLNTYINGPQHVDEMQAGQFTGAWMPLDLVAKANEAGSVGEAGSSAAHYANTNYVLLGLIVEELTGNHWAQEIEARIIKPLDLQQTTFLSKDGTLDTVIGGYAKMETGYQNLLEASWYPHPSTVWAAGEIVATVGDLMTFASALFDGKLVSPETLAVMSQPLGTDVNSGILWSLGGGTIEMLPPGSFGMGGDIPGFHAFFMGVRGTNLVAATMINTEEGDAIGPTLAAMEYLAALPSSEQEAPAVAYTPAITDAAGNEIPGSIAAIETVMLGGFEQTITVRGADITNPVLLFLHGGPGVPSAPWATWNNFHAELEDHFVVVHWDQRGAGKSFSAELTPDDMHIESLVSDTLELTDILRTQFAQDKIFLWGHSWGSGLGFETLRVNAQPYHAYIASAVRPELS